MKKLPEEIGQLTNLKRLRMVSCSYSYYSGSLDMPESFSALKNLEYIEVGYKFGSNARFANYPRFSKFERSSPPINLEPLQLARDIYAKQGECLSYIFKHAPKKEQQQLFEQFYDEAQQKWDVGGEGLYHIPSWVREYPIRILNLTNCYLGHAATVGGGCVEEHRQQLDQAFEHLGGCQYLETLILRKNGLTYLPKPIFLLKNLKHLDLGWDIIRNIPEEIQQLENLESIVLSGAIVYEDVEHLRKLPSLQSITLTQNYFSHERGQKALAEFKAIFLHCKVYLE
ncbi:MAG: hypothetical protein GY810_27235 [Aureispira sp.]|nr:hypothetical protein [Aureispira sp.]